MTYILTINQLFAILTATEGAKKNTVSYPVPYAEFGHEPPMNQRGRYGGNHSGFSFGRVQLDIGNNPIAREAYEQILQLGV